MKLISSSSVNAICFKIASDIETASKHAINNHGRFSLVLSGGKTPLSLFKVLVESFSQRIDWNLVDLFWTDERYVPHSHPESNYGNAFKHLIKHLPIGNVYPINYSGDIHADTASYNNTINAYFRNNSKQGGWFDYILLGFGLDGHIASLFCMNDICFGTDNTLYKKMEYGHDRISMSYESILKAQNISLLSLGKDKIEYILKVDNPTKPVARLPICTKIFTDQILGSFS